MSKLTDDKQDQLLAFLKKSRRKAVIAMWGSLLTAICLVVLLYVSKKTYGKEQFENNTRIDVVGAVLMTSSFLTLVGASLSIWLVMDTAAMQQRLLRSDKDITKF